MVVLVMSLFLLSLMDIHSSYIGIVQQDRKELNPLAAALMRSIGFWPACIIKEVVTVVALLGLLRISAHLPWTWWVLLALNGFYLWAVGDNYRKNGLRNTT